VVFKHASRVCARSTVPRNLARTCRCHFKNSITFRQDPHEGITIRFGKKPGLAMEMEERVFTIDLRQGDGSRNTRRNTKNFLLDCINATRRFLFVARGRRNVAFCGPIVKGWAKGLVPCAAMRRIRSGRAEATRCLIAPHDDGAEKISAGPPRSREKRSASRFGKDWARTSRGSSAREKGLARGRVQPFARAGGEYH